MHWSIVQRIVGLLLMLFSATMLPPAGVAWLYGDGALVPFVAASGVILAAGASWLWFCSGRFSVWRGGCRFT